MPKSRAVGTQFVGYQQFRCEALFLEQLAYQPQRSTLASRSPVSVQTTPERTGFATRT
jgi:hypothetical protein